jgi:simple sugar transport system ATP-binding protein
MSHVSKHYGSVSALDDAQLLVRPGTIHALLGENGAGKTTLMRIAYGMVRPDTATIRVDGRDFRPTSPVEAIAAGIGMVHQHFTLVPTMTVAENIALGGRGRLHRREMEERVREISRQTGFALDPSARTESLSVGAQQRVEIAKALARKARLLILDEPTAVLAPGEVDDLLRWLRNFAAVGHAVVLITHKLREALAVADDVSVLRRGRIVHAGAAAAASSALLTEAMVGSATATFSREEGTSAELGGTVMFDAAHVSIADSRGRTTINDATFTARSGEILGIAAVEGAGQHELLRALAGRTKIVSGVLTRPSLVGFVPEDRHRDAVLLDRSLTENVALRGAGTRRGVVDWASFHARTASLLSSFDVRASGPGAAVRSLSGGNQQKLVLARELASEHGSLPDALVVENPTRGLDVRATAAVHDRLRAARDRGAAVVLYSSDLDEVLTLASRVLVLFGGTARELPVDREEVGRAMLGLR